ncbi:MAG TPA: aminofutalosine synthase MqnE, partial [Syntrophomonas wolfei]|nr:aminofutalosine synthase MqnE [Syntrophomonas wolfei]
MDNRLEEIKNKVNAGERLSREDGIYLYQSNDLLAIGEMARNKKLSVSGRRVYFNINRHINLTNICVSRCRFCAFG